MFLKLVVLFALEKDIKALNKLELSLKVLKFKEFVIINLELVAKRLF